MGQDALNDEYNKKTNTDLELLEMQIKHTQDLRRSLCGEPSAETLAAWRLEGARMESMRRYYARQEAGEEEREALTRLPLPCHYAITLFI